MELLSKGGTDMHYVDIWEHQDGSTGVLWLTCKCTARILIRGGPTSHGSHDMFSQPSCVAGVCAHAPLNVTLHQSPLMLPSVQYLAEGANALARQAIYKGMAWAIAHTQICRDSMPDGNKYLGLLNTCGPTPIWTTVQVSPSHAVPVPRRLV
jgi:hypothetical protein